MQTRSGDIEMITKHERVTGERTMSIIVKKEWI